MEGPVKLFQRQGSFGDYIIDGTLWRFADGSVIWRMIVTLPKSGQPNATRVNVACRVSVDTDEIQCVEVDMGFPEIEEVKVGQVVTNVAPSIKGAVQAAKRAWMEELRKLHEEGQP